MRFQGLGRKAGAIEQDKIAGELHGFKSVNVVSNTASVESLDRQDE